MSKKVYELILMLLLNILFSFCLLFGQDDGVRDSDRELITNKLNLKLGCECGIVNCINIDVASKPKDSTETEYEYRPDKNDWGYENPYGTLTHCFVFSYYREKPRTDGEGKGSIGIFRDNQIVALLDTAIEALTSSSGRLKKIVDLNKDGEVDIVITRTLGVSPPPWEGYWIISWNGKRFRIINAVTDDNFRESVIVAPWDYLRFIDLDGDGIYEMTTQFEDEKGVERDHIYSWNGKLYGEWGKSSKAFSQNSCQKRK